VNDRLRIKNVNQGESIRNAVAASTRNHGQAGARISYFVMNQAIRERIGLTLNSPFMLLQDFMCNIPHSTKYIK
jgi:hypothetical protein